MMMLLKLPWFTGNKFSRDLTHDNTLREKRWSTIGNLLCCSSSPRSFILFASCWAFFFSRQPREANLFFSRRADLLTFVLSPSTPSDSIALLIFSSSRPILKSFLTLGVRSFPSPRRAFPVCFTRTPFQSVSLITLDWNTGSTGLLRTCGSFNSASGDEGLLNGTSRLGPFAWMLYCQKCRGFRPGPSLALDGRRLDAENQRKLEASTVRWQKITWNNNDVVFSYSLHITGWWQEHSIVIPMNFKEKWNLNNWHVRI